MIGFSGVPPGEGPPPGGEAVDGDPVDLYTGLFVLEQADMVLPDVIPIVLSRVYRPRDSTSRVFGRGSMHPYNLYLVGDNANFTYAELMLADGGRIRYERISPGNTYFTTVMEHTATPTGFYKSRLTWNGNGWDIKLPDGTVLVFGDRAPLQLIRDRYGNELRLTRQGGASGNITKITSPNGRWIDLTYDASLRITLAKDNIGRTVGYTYDASGRLWKVTNHLGEVTEYTYDTSHRMLTIKDARGILYLTNEYDADGRVIRQTLADNNTYQFAYTLDGNGKVTQTEVTNPRSIVRRVTFNASGYTLSDTFAVGSPEQQTYTYERQSGTNFLLSVTDPLSRRAAYAYDSMGNVTSATWLDGTPQAVTTSYTYEPTFNHPASITDPLNHTTSFAYNSKGDMVSITDPLNNQDTFTYNGQGQLLTATTPDMKTVQFTYDQGDLVAVTDPLGNTATQFIDAAGRVLSVTNPIGQTVRFDYDAVNRPLSVTDPLAGVTSFTYNASHNLRSVTDARNNTIGYDYNNMDRLISRTDPLLHNDTYVYDAAGNITQVTDRKNQVTTYAYDGLDRLSQVTFADSSTISYTYDAANRLTQIVDSVSGAITFGYDNFDRLTSETTPQGTVSYTYDAAGRQTSMTVAGQSAVQYTYDNADRLTQVGQGAASVTFTYDNASRLATQTLPNGVVTEYGIDGAARLTSMTYKKAGSTLGDVTYRYNAAGQQIAMGGSMARTGLPQALSSPSYNAANQLTGHNGQTLTYDLNGNLTGDGTNTYVWNARDQLVSISGPGLSASFNYDALGRRKAKTVNGATTSHLYNGDNITQEQAGGSATANIVTGGLDQLFQRTDASGTTSPLLDALGSIIALTDSSGAVQTSYTYEPYGKTTVTGTSSSNPSQYTGRDNDQTGLYYYRARYYSPSLHRFICEDPIGIAGGINLYSYAGNNPVSFSDPYGLSFTDFIGGLLEADGPLGGVGGFRYVDPFGGLAAPGLPGVNRNSCDYKAGMYAGEVLGLIEAVAGAVAGVAAAARWARGAARAARGAGRGAGRGLTGGGGGRAGGGGGAAGGGAKSNWGSYRPKSGHPRDPRSGNPIPESPYPHTQVGEKISKKTGKPYTKGREFGENGKHVKDVDFTIMDAEIILIHINISLIR